MMNELICKDNEGASRSNSNDDSMKLNMQPLNASNLTDWKRGRRTFAEVQDEAFRSKTELKKTMGLDFSELRETHIDISSSSRILETPISDSNANISYPADGGDIGLLPESCSSTHLLEDETQFSFRKTKRRTKVISKFKMLSEACSRCCRRRNGTHSDYHYTSRYCLHRLLVALRFPGIIIAFFISFIVLCIFSGLTGHNKVLPASSNRGDEWWRCALMYEIFPASFADTNGDGFGDMNGISAHLDHLKSLNIDVVRLGSIFSALDYPVRYKHVIDFDNMDPHLGKVSHFQTLIDQIHERGMHLVLDINPTMTSDQHPWAAHWMLNKNGEYKNFFVSSSEDLRKLKLVEVNGTFKAWLNMDGTWREPIRGFGGHALLNWSHPEVRTNMKNSLKFWLSKNIDGFNMKNLENLYTDSNEDFIDVIREWRELLNEFSVLSGRRKVLIGSEHFMQHVSKERWDILEDVISNFDVIDMQLKVNNSKQMVDGYKRLNIVQKTLKTGIVNLYIDSIENERVATVLGTTMNEGLAMMLFMVPTTVTLLYGQEISLKDAIDPETSQILEDGQLTSMLWSRPLTRSSAQNSSWLPIVSNYSVYNCEDQINSINRLVNVSSIRKDVEMCQGATSSNVIVSDGSDFIVLKIVSAAKQFLLFINPTNEPVDIGTQRSFIQQSDLVRVISSTSKKRHFDELLQIDHIVVYDHEIILTQLLH